MASTLPLSGKVRWMTAAALRWQCIRLVGCQGDCRHWDELVLRAAADRPIAAREAPQPA